MSTTRRPALLALTALFILALLAWTSARVTAAVGRGSVVAAPAAAMPACAGVLTALQRPAQFPASFPLPPGAIITKVDAIKTGVVLTAIAPLDAHGVAVYWD